MLCYSTVQTCDVGTPLILSGDLCRTLCTVMSSSNLMFASYFFGVVRVQMGLQLAHWRLRNWIVQD